MRRQGVNLGQRLHYETGVKMIDKVAHAIHRVIPGTIAILVLQYEVQVPLRDVPIVIITKYARCAR